VGSSSNNPTGGDATSAWTSITESGFERGIPLVHCFEAVQTRPPIEVLIDRKTLQRTEYFADFLVRHKVYPGISMYLEDQDGRMFDYRFGTSNPHKKFGCREVFVLNAQWPDEEPETRMGSFEAAIVLRFVGRDSHRGAGSDPFQDAE